MTLICNTCKWEWDCHGRFLLSNKCIYSVGTQDFTFYEEKEGDENVSKT